MTDFEILTLTVSIVGLLFSSIVVLLKLFASLVKFFDGRYRRK